MNRFFRYKLDHGLFWVATVGFYVFTRSGLFLKIGPGLFILDAIARNVLLAIVIYFHLYFLIPRYLRAKKYFRYVAGMVISVCFYVLQKNALDLYLHDHISDMKSKYYFFSNSYYNFSILAFYLLFSVALELSKQWFLQREQLRKTQMEKLKTELSYLKAQMNPHFLFNSLNSIYFQIDRNNPARETLMKFSDMLRYQLYECNVDMIDIESEVEYLKNYVELQKIRKDENYKVEFRAEEEVRNFKIAPLLLIPFVENAFKHISSYSEKENIVRIGISKKEDSFYFNVFNTVDEINNIDSSEHKGIGLDNVKRRLELLYNGKYQLNIENSGTEYSLYLKIDLS